MKTKIASLLSVALLSIGMPVWAQTTLPPSNNGIFPAAFQPAPAAQPAPAPMDAPADNSIGGYFTAGGGAYFMTPVFQSNPAFIMRHTFGADVATNQTDFTQRMTGAPLAWIGFTFDNGWGIRARWFEFNSSVDASSQGLTGTSNIVFVPGGFGIPIAAADKIFASERLSVNVIDIEATNNFVFDRWAFLASAGIRYAHVGQNYDFEINPGTNLFTVTSNHNFNGFGPTLGLEVRRAICETDLYFYSSARGSILFGSSDDGGILTDNRNEDPTYLSGAHASVLSIGELEIGAEWSHCIGRVRFSAQLALVGQIWWGGGDPSLVQSLVNMSNSSTNIHSAIPAGGNFGFVGGVGRFGVSF